MRKLKCILTQNDCCIEASVVSQKGIVIHSTGANNPYLKRYVQPSENDPSKNDLLKLIGVNTYGNSWNKSGVTKAVHYMIGKLADESIATVQLLPEQYSCWGCGKGSKGSYNYAPDAHIQFEVCEDDLTNEEYFDAIYKEATELCADICHRHGWDSSVIVSHKEAHALGYASNHRDIDHWLNAFGLTMRDFRADVQKILDNIKLAPADEGKTYEAKVIEDPFILTNNAGEKIGFLMPEATIEVISEDDETVTISARVKRAAIKKE